MQTARAILVHSNGSPEKVCRNLFGPVDHELVRQDCERMMNSTVEEAKERWNFDFVTETPMEGMYEWEKVDDADPHPKESEGSTSNFGRRKQPLITEFFPVKRHCCPGLTQK